jgi:hypothetical protein
MLAVALRQDDRVVTLEVAIPKAKYDGIALLELVENWGRGRGPELAVIEGGKASGIESELPTSAKTPVHEPEAA